MITLVSSAALSNVKISGSNVLISSALLILITCLLSLSLGIVVVSRHVDGFADSCALGSIRFYLMFGTTSGTFGSG